MKDWWVEKMKLYIKQKIFSFRGRFYIRDENNRNRFYAEGVPFTWGRKLYVYDIKGNQVGFISKKIWSFLRKYYIEVGGRTYTLVKEYTFFRSRYYLEGLSWTMKGDFMAHEYSLEDYKGIVMSMSKHWFTWGDSYELDIVDPDNEVLCLSIALAIDCMNADSSNNN